jgi:hypothetical protein
VISKQWLVNRNCRKIALAVSQWLLHSCHPGRSATTDRAHTLQDFTGSCSFEPKNCKAMNCQQFYITAFRRTGIRLSFCCHPGPVPGSAYTVLIADTKQAPEHFGVAQCIAESGVTMLHSRCHPGFIPGSAYTVLITR